MATREQLIQQIRILGRGSRGAPPAILDLSDPDLYEVFEQLQRGLSSRAVARHLRFSGLMQGSENSLQQSVSLFRKRIATLMVSNPSQCPLPSTPVRLPADLDSLPHDELLSGVRDIERSYRTVIKQALQIATSSAGRLAEDLPKHIKAYNEVVATRAKLEQMNLKTPSVTPDDREFEERANRVLEFYADNEEDADKMVKAANIFLQKAEARIIELKQDTNGEWQKMPNQRPGRMNSGYPH
jgi:hypothetical protein